MRAVERQARLALLTQAPAALSLSPDRLHGATPQPEGALVSRAADKGRAGVALPATRGSGNSRYFKGGPEPRLSGCSRWRAASSALPGSRPAELRHRAETRGNRVTLEAAALARQVSYPTPGLRRAGRINPPG